MILLRSILVGLGSVIVVKSLGIAPFTPEAFGVLLGLCTIGSAASLK